MGLPMPTDLCEGFSAQRMPTIGDYELIEILGVGVDVWQNCDCPHVTAIEVEGGWEVIVLRSRISTLEDYLRKGGVEFYLNSNYDPCRPQIADVQQHGVKVAAVLARRSFEKRVAETLGLLFLSIGITSRKCIDL